MTNHTMAHLHKIQARHSPLEVARRVDGSRHIVCAYCWYVAGLRWVSVWPCPDRQNADKGLKEN